MCGKFSFLPRLDNKNFKPLRICCLGSIVLDSSFPCLKVIQNMKLGTRQFCGYHVLPILEPCFSEAPAQSKVRSDYADLLHWKLRSQTTDDDQ